MLGRCLSDRKLTITTAESCTGGGIAQAITDAPGSSAWFSQGFVTYSNAAKQQLLQVPQNIIEQHGAVSREVVESMALGAMELADADLAVSVSGIAGPDGGSIEKPVGTVWIGFARRGCPAMSHLFLFSGNRKSVRNQSVEEALKGALNIAQEYTV